MKETPQKVDFACQLDFYRFSGTVYNKVCHCGLSSNGQPRRRDRRWNPSAWNLQIDIMNDDLKRIFSPINLQVSIEVSMECAWFVEHNEDRKSTRLNSSH